MRGTRIPLGADARRMSDARARIPPRAAPAATRRSSSTLMRSSVAFHQPWASAPTDAERFAAYIADSARTDFEAMLLCRREDHAILGLLQPLADRPPVTAERIPRLRRRRARSPARATCARGSDLVLQRAFTDLRLHRVEANIQPGNHASLALARGAGLPAARDSLPATSRSTASGATTSAGRSWSRTGGRGRPPKAPGLGSVMSHGSAASPEPPATRLRLRQVLEPLRDGFGLILIDTPPGLGTLSGIAILAADGLLIRSDRGSGRLAPILSARSRVRVLPRAEPSRPIEVEHCRPEASGRRR